MDEWVFTTKDVLTIGGGVVATITAYLTVKFELKAHKEASEKEIMNIKEEFLNAKNGRRAIEKKAEINLKDGLDVVNKRIDKTQERMEEYQRSNQVEFKDINEKLNRIIGLLEKK